jgi:hypothetical protein
MSASRPVLGVIPIPDETLVSFMFRLAVSQGYPTAQALLRPTGEPRPTNRPNALLLRKYADLAGVAVADIERLGWGPPDPTHGEFRGHRLANAMFGGTFQYGNPRMVCPLCLEEAPYYRAWWDLVPVSVCVTHAVRLIWSCPTCGENLRWNGRYLTACKCGSDLRASRTSPVDRADLIGTEAIHGLLGDGRFSDEAASVRGMPPFADMSDAEIVDFLWRLGLELLGPRKKAFSVEQPNELAADAHVALTRAVHAMRIWPDGFRQAIDLMLDRWGRTGTKDALRRWREKLDDGHGAVIAEVATKHLGISIGPVSGPLNS